MDEEFEISNDENISDTEYGQPNISYNDYVASNPTVDIGGPILANYMTSVQRAPTEGKKDVNVNYQPK
jgi:hypothetical protein